MGKLLEGNSVLLPDNVLNTNLTKYKFASLTSRDVGPYTRAHTQRPMKSNQTIFYSI